MPDIEFSMSADEKDVIRGIKAVAKEQSVLRDQIMGLVTASKAAGGADMQLSQQRMAALAPLVGKQKELREATDQLKKQLDAGTITADEYKTAFEGLSKESNGLRVELQKLQAQVAEDVDDFRRAAAATEKAENKTEQYARAVKELNRWKEKGAVDGEKYNRLLQIEKDKLSDTGAAADKSGGLIGGLTSKMSGFVSGLASGAVVIATIKSEYDALIERQGKSRDANISLAAAQSDALDNLDASMTPTEFAKRMKDSSKRLGMSEKDLTVAASSALSAKGDKSAADAIAAVEASAKLNRFAPEKLPDMAASTLDLGKHLKMKPEEALGFLIGVGQSSRVVSLKNTAENIAPAIIGGVSQGIPKEKAAAIAASITGTAVDSTGKPTNTTMQALFGQLKEFGSAEFGFTGGPEHEQKVAALDAEHVKQKAALKAQFDKEQISLSQAEMPAAQKAEAKRQLDAREVEARAALKASQESQQTALSGQMPSFTPEQMLDRIMKDPELKATFFRDKKFGGYGASFEKAMMPAVNQLLTPGTQGHNDYQAALAAQMKVNPQQLFDNAVKAKESLAPIQIATQDQKLGNAVNTAQLRDIKGAESAVIRQQLDEFRAAMGDGYFTRTLKGVFNDVKTGGVQTYDTAIRSIESDIGEKQKSINYRSNLAPGGDREFRSNPAMAAAQKRDEELVKAMREMVDLLKEQRDQQQQNAAENQANNHAGAVAARAQEGRP